MLESNEDTNAPGDKLPPRRRRRAASRPAGPPVTGATAEPTETPEPTGTAVAAEDPVVGAPPGEAPAGSYKTRRAHQKA
ncbi:hypothetical protein, partial [Streptomyces venezuelae]|uniref:hypothetical protein n=1 Tax=Streptomyces venezuelae TaxID=54571 RepID=UPI00278C4102